MTFGPWQPATDRECSFVRREKRSGVQRWLHLPSEVSLQHLVLPHGWLVQFFNGYYGLAHGPALIIGLVWLFVRHRDRYPAVRNSVALVTGLCLVIRLFPVAPPRLLPDLGFVDTALRYNQSVYGVGIGGMSNQLAAMPSIHVAWALIVALAAVTASRSRWRWLAVGHLVLTVLAVTVTANHWWLDGIVAAVLLWGAMAVQHRPGDSKRTAEGAVARPSSASVAAATRSATASPPTRLGRQPRVGSTHGMGQQRAAVETARRQRALLGRLRPRP